jgi:hypothetical protein
MKEKSLSTKQNEITTPLIVYIWRRRGGTCKFGFEFHLGCETSLLLSCDHFITVNAFIPQWNFKRMHSILKWKYSFYYFFICNFRIKFWKNLKTTQVVWFISFQFTTTVRWQGEIYLETIRQLPLTLQILPGLITFKSSIITNWMLPIP